MEYSQQRVELIPFYWLMTLLLMHLFFCGTLV
jgi:hypothetical protein